MGDYIVYIILLIIIAGAIYGTVKRIRHGSSCCGEHDPAPKKVKVTDKNKDHYPFTYELNVDGMHCANCARRIENSFNSHDGLWAKADLGRKSVELKSKKAVDETLCRDIISSAGYTLLNMNRIT